MIGVPFNDLHCLGSITEVVAELVEHRDGAIVDLAALYPTTQALAAFIRSLPQRNDDGEPGDGPKVKGCSPAQRLRIPAEDPNCVERAALYLAVAELIDPRPVRQLATLETPEGLHTFPIESGAPIILDPDPQSPRNGLAEAVACAAREPIRIEAMDAVVYTTQLAESAAVNHRNGPSVVARARNAILDLVERGTPVAEDEVDGVGILLALAERVARRYGARALAIVRTTAKAIAELADAAIARAQRNLALRVGGSSLTLPTWTGPASRAVLHLGEDVAGLALRAQLAQLGLSPQLLDAMERELRTEGLSLGRLANPPVSASMIWKARAA